MSRLVLRAAAACGLLLVCRGVCPPGTYIAPGVAPAAPGGIVAPPPSGAAPPAAPAPPVACIPCPLFRFSDKPDTPGKCAKCAKETFTRVRGATACEACPKNSESYAIAKDAVKDVAKESIAANPQAPPDEYYAYARFMLGKKVSKKFGKQCSRPADEATKTNAPTTHTHLYPPLPTKK